MRAIQKLFRIKPEGANLDNFLLSRISFVFLYAQLLLTAILFPCSSSLNLAHAQVLSTSAPLAGLKPYQRPMGAPRISAVSKANQDKILSQGLKGISSPIPNSLSFLKSQGNWYTPFTHPGMVDHYDIRQWHIH